MPCIRARSASIWPTLAAAAQFPPYLISPMAFELVPALQRAGVAFRATDIDPLAQRPVIQDVLTLLKALLNPADRISWLALLRAPLKP